MYGREIGVFVVNPDKKKAVHGSDQIEEYTDAYHIIFELFSIAGQNVQEQMDRVQKRYGFDEERAANFIKLKYAMKEELNYKGVSGRKLIEVCNQYTREKLIEAGVKHGLKEESVLELLPAIAKKLAQHELKSRQQFFARSQQYDEARAEIDSKYQRRFGL